VPLGEAHVSSFRHCWGLSLSGPAPSPAFAWGAATWYGWLLVGVYIFLLNVQGNVLPFLQDEFRLSYGEAGLHSSAIAAGTILVGLFGERVTPRLGRKRSLWIAVGGLALGAGLLCVSPAAWASVTSCFLIGTFGAMIPAVVPALLADVHSERRAEAYAGLSIVAYVFGFAAPLLTGLFISWGFGWRAAVLVGAAIGIGIALAFRRTAIAEPAPHAVHAASRGLSAAFWAYWALLVASCALEYCILFFAPAFLQRVIGLSAASAATGAAAFPLGMLLGRITLGYLVRRVPQTWLLTAALAITMAGFVAYWGISQPAVSIAGLFVIGLGIAPLYPLVTNFAVGAAGHAKDIATVRLAVAFGISLLVAPIALGYLSDSVGLSPAHLALPGLVAVAYACFFIASMLQARAQPRSA
jgi:MFS transporter, DHA1 family, inner membrane transport protein